MNLQKIKLTSLIVLVFLVGSSFIIPIILADDYDSYEIIQTNYFFNETYDLGDEDKWVFFITSPGTHFLNFSIITVDASGYFVGDFNISIIDEDNYFNLINGTSYLCLYSVVANITSFSYIFNGSGFYYLRIKNVDAVRIMVQGYWMFYKKIVGTVIYEDGGDIQTSNYIPGFSLLLIGIISLVSISIVIWKTRSKTHR